MKKITKRMERYGLLRFILHLKREMDAITKNKHVKGYYRIKGFFKNKRGLEVGGPSAIFRPYDYIPVYNKAKLLDGVNFSSSTIWTGQVDDKKGFIINDKQVGELYLADTTDLSVIPDESYDFLLSSNNIEHIANPMKAVEQWLLKLKKQGILVVVAPRKESNFDHQRAIVTFEHILEDFHNNVGEDDLTHIEEILSLHDLSRDPLAGNFEQFKDRSYKNLENRCLHHHIFDLEVLEQIFIYFNIEVVKRSSRENDYTIIGRK
jgi:ubiquinone/menaquinone biosynthesis C-methylase UbiE